VLDAADPPPWKCNKRPRQLAAQPATPKAPLCPSQPTAPPPARLVATAKWARPPGATPTPARRTPPPPPPPPRDPRTPPAPPPRGSVGASLDEARRAADTRRAAKKAHRVRGGRKVQAARAQARAATRMTPDTGVRWEDL